MKNIVNFNKWSSKKINLVNHSCKKRKIWQRIKEKKKNERKENFFKESRKTRVVKRSWQKRKNSSKDREKTRISSSDRERPQTLSRDRVKVCFSSRDWQKTRILSIARKKLISPSDCKKPQIPWNNREKMGLLLKHRGKKNA